MGDLSEQQKRKFLEIRTPYIANDGDFSIPIIITNSATTKKWTSKKQNKNDSQRSGKAFTTSIAKAKFIHYLMAMNHESHKTQRQIADRIDVSLGAVNKYLKELVESNYIVNDSNRLRLVDPGKMLELWTVEYLRRILPKVEKHLFDANSDKQYMDLRTTPVKLKNGYWSGAKAADLVIGSELPNRFLIYSDSPHEVAKELRLRPTENGKIEIRKKFWNFDWKEEKQGIVDLPLIYADLMDSADPRDLKIAREIREIWIKPL